MNTEILFFLINNTALLLALVVLYDVLFFNVDMNTRLKSVATGIIIGFIGIFLMLNSLELLPGIFLDVRVILLSIAGFFFGFVPTVIGALIIISYRIYWGGSGVVAGITITIISVILGLLWRRFHEKLQNLFGRFDLYILGLLNFMIMLFNRLLFPSTLTSEAQKLSIIPLLFIFPIGTVLLGTLLKNQLSRKNTQDALRENETMLRNFIDNVPVGMFRISSERKVIQTNPKMAHILGLNTPEQAISYFQDMRDQIYVDPKNPTEITTTIQKQGYIENFECEILRADGRRIWALINARTSSHLKADSFMTDGFIHDITERKLAELELKKSREQFMLAVNGSHDGIWDWDLRDNSLYLSTRCKEMFEYDDHMPSHLFSIIGKKIHPDDQFRVRNDLEKYLNGEIPGFKIEFRVIDRNGNNIWIQVRGAALRSENGTAYRMAGSITDITERKEAEIKIAEEAVRRRILIEQSRDGIVIIDQDGKVFEANKKYTDMLGYSPEEVLTLHLWDWDIQFTREEMLQMMRNIDESGAHFETRHKRKDGTLFDVEVSSNAAMFGKQKLIFNVCRDITERKQAERELLKAKLEAESANRAKSQFVATMSHELRTPLTAVIGFSDILSTNASDKLTEKELGYIGNINKNGKHLLNLINDILDLSIIDAGKMELECENFFVKEVFDEILTMMSLMASKKNIDIRINNEIPFEKIFADRVKFKQIMYNLLSNAIKFTHDNGMVSVIAEKSETAIEISVSDTGIGIPKDRLKDIFNPFTQVDSSNTRKYGGTGLGLAIVKQLVEMHKGIIWVESEEGKGSTFVFTIPMK